MVQDRHFGGRMRRLKRSGATYAEARRRVLRALDDALRSTRDGEFTSRSTLADGARAWLAMFGSQVDRGSRSPSTLDLYQHVVDRHIIPGVGGLRLGEVTTAGLDRFVQAVLADKGYATAKLCRQALSGICGLLVRRDGLTANPVRDLSPIELDRDRVARAMTPREVRDWLAILDASPVAARWDLPELTRFMLATGVRLGEALGVRWSDVDLEHSTISIERTVVRLRGRGLVASRLKTRTSARVLVLPPGAWTCSRPGGCGWAPSTDRCSRTPKGATATATTSARRIARSGPGPGSTGSRRTPIARRWRRCSTARVPRRVVSPTSSGTPGCR
jgi:integrase